MNYLGSTSRRHLWATSSAAVSAGTAPTSSKKQRLIDAMKVTLEIAKELTDVPPPLKSCLAGINALIKHYDELKGVKDKLEDLVPWLTALEECLKKANSDPQEAERREKLKRSLESVANTTERLLKKRRMYRFLDKSQDSQTVVKLVEQLQRAILIYQVSQQQSMHDQICRLVAGSPSASLTLGLINAPDLNRFMETQQISPAVKDKVVSILEPCCPLASVTNPGGQVDGDEPQHCEKLLASTVKLETKLRSLSARFADASYSGTEGDRRMYEFVEEV